MSGQDEIIGIANNNSQATLNARKRDYVLGETDSGAIFRQGFEAGRQHGKNEATDKFEQDREAKAMEFGKLVQKKSSLKVTIKEAINNFSMESGSDTPDFILADFLVDCLTSYDKALVAREKWYGRDCGGLKGPIPVSGIPNPPTEPPASNNPKPLEALDEQEGSGAETFDNPQTEKLDSFQLGYKAGYADAGEDHGSIAEDEACANIFKSARENGMSLSMSYSMAYAAAKHLAGEM